MSFGGGRNAHTTISDALSFHCSALQSETVQLPHQTVMHTHPLTHSSLVSVTARLRMHLTQKYPANSSSVVRNKPLMKAWWWLRQTAHQQTLMHTREVGVSNEVASGWRKGLDINTLLQIYFNFPFSYSFDKTGPAASVSASVSASVWAPLKWIAHQAVACQLNKQGA